MNVTEHESGLLVCEYGGTGRSGKGTLVRDGAQEDGVEGDETGADYRALTKSLLVEGQIHEEMDGAEITAVAQQVSTDALQSLAARKAELIKEFGFDSLYAPDVNQTVPHVSKVPPVRKAIKAGLQERVKNFRDDPDTRLLLVDGRNLAPVIEQVPKVSVIMRTFVECDAAEAARRECRRDGKPLGGDEEKEVRAAIESRNQTDAARAEDPVRADGDAISYNEHFRHNGTRLQDRQRNLGWLAATEGRQVRLDTTDLSLPEMKNVARELRDGALSAALSRAA